LGSDFISNRWWRSIGAQRCRVASDTPADVDGGRNNQTLCLTGNRHRQIS
jgi:hypothetical protein